MCRKIRNNFVIAFSYVSVIAIGVLIYLVIFLFAEKRQSASKNQIRDFITFPRASKKVAESNADSANMAKNSAESESEINELPNEIDSALNVLETPIDSANAESSAPAEIFPRDFIVDAKIINVRASANTQAKIIKRFKEGAIISIRKIEGQWAQLANGGFVFAPLLKEMPPKAPAKEAKKPKDSAKNQAKKSAESSKKSQDSAKSQNLPAKNPTK